MAQKYDIYCESGWNDITQSPKYERISSTKNEKAAINFVSSIDNIGKYGNMLLRMKSSRGILTYNDINGEWEYD